jgi:hypothetical protein
VDGIEKEMAHRKETGAVVVNMEKVAVAAKGLIVVRGLVQERRAGRCPSHGLDLQEEAGRMIETEDDMKRSSRIRPASRSVREIVEIRNGEIEMNRMMWWSCGYVQRRIGKAVQVKTMASQRLFVAMCKILG